VYNLFDKKYGDPARQEHLQDLISQMDGTEPSTQRPHSFRQCEERSESRSNYSKRPERERFHLVLVDVMPEMNGFEATASIREQEQRTGGHLPIIAITAHAIKGDEERCLAAGMDGYLPKPIRPKELFETMDRLLFRSTMLADESLNEKAGDRLHSPESLA
jgi:CheY-like chemotaxis protein